MTDDPTGQDWTADELDLIVADYYSMLQSELMAVPYSRTEHRIVLIQLIKRSKGAIEYKHQNISAVLMELGLPWINGYKPASNYQTALFDAIGRHLEARPDLLEPAPVSRDDTLNPNSVFVPPPSHAARQPSNESLVRLVRRFDPAARDERNRRLGKAGEELVLKVERARLTHSGHEHLAERVRWVSHEDGDGAGYDILSFDTTGSERLLKVKTTCGAERTPFYISRNELALSEERPHAFRLVRVHQFANDPKIFELTAPLASHVSLEPVSYQGWWS